MTSAISQASPLHPHRKRRASSAGTVVNAVGVTQVTPRAVASQGFASSQPGVGAALIAPFQSQQVRSARVNASVGVSGPNWLFPVAGAVIGLCLFGIVGGIAGAIAGVLLSR